MFTKNTRNRFDNRDSLELGQRAEDRFARCALKNAWEIEKVSENENLNDHFDYRIRKGEEKYKVEVKSAKRISRNDNQVQYELLWIELHGVRSYDRGWLFGDADLIAFETRAGFKLVIREDLIRIVNKLVDYSSRVETPREALYKIYSRNNRPDQLSLIKMADLDTIIWAEWL